VCCAVQWEPARGLRGEARESPAMDSEEDEAPLTFRRGGQSRQAQGSSAGTEIRRQCWRSREARGRQI